MLARMKKSGTVTPHCAHAVGASVTSGTVYCANSPVSPVSAPIPWSGRPAARYQYRELPSADSDMCTMPCSQEPSRVSFSLGTEGVRPVPLTLLPPGKQKNGAHVS